MTDRLTLEKIGQIAGVSRATASRVVNDHPNVSPDVRARVWRVIKETGYQQNQAARSLAANRSGIIGLIIPRMVQSLFTDPYYPRLLQGITKGANDCGNTLSLFLFHTEDEEKKLTPKVLSRGFLDGVIIASSHLDDPLIRRLLTNQMPHIFVGRPQETLEASFVDVDNLSGAITAVTHLVRNGRKRIGTITGRLDMSAGIDRLQGYYEALNSRGIKVDEKLVAVGDFEESVAYGAMLRLAERNPDGIFAASDAMALGALRALNDLGKRVPDEVAIVGFDDLPPAATASPSLTTIRQPIKRIGELAVETLMEIIEEGVSPAKRRILPAELIIRKSCGFI